jgi:two-component system sensor histidine kinase KdpD
MERLLLGIGLVSGVSAALVPLRADVNPAIPALALVVSVVAAALAGGRTSAVMAALVAAVAFNLAFIPPYWTFEVRLVEDLVALGVFTVVALAMGTLIAREAQQRRTAQSHAAELEAVQERLTAVAAERSRLAAETTRLAVLEQVDAQRAALLRSVSHDLRTPLSTIRAVTSDLRAGAQYDPATRDELLDLVLDEAERLDRIVGNLLSLSRIEAGAFQPRRQAVDVGELVHECLERLSRPLRHMRLEIEIPEALPLVDADYSQLDQVVTNLLENAARHASTGAALRIDAQHRDGSVAVAVEDEGPGIPLADRDHIFEPFWHGPGGSTSGVGLSICKAIVEAHGGDIHAEDGSGGARFVFTVPVHHG